MSTPEAAIAAPSPAVLALGGAAFYIRNEDALLLTVFNAASGVTVAITGRMLPLGATTPEPFKRTLTPTTDRVASTVLVTLGDGWLLNAQVIVSAGSPFVAQTFARLSIVHGLGSVAEELCTLCAGDVTAKMPLAYPGSPVANSLASAGALRAIAGTQPAAGAEVSETVPTGARWLLLAAELDLVTNGNAANRVPQLTIDDGTTVYARVSGNQNETASKTWRNSFVQGGQQIADVTRFIITTPIGDGLMLGAGHRIRTVTSAIDAGDQYGVPQLLVKEWIEGA
jgi:hypothetical protein